MKVLKINVIMVIMFSCLLNCALFARQPEPSTTIAAYNNKISQISYSVGSHDQHAITFLCQDNPICMYTPLSYMDSSPDSLTKTYFLPRMECESAQIQHFYKDLHESFKSLGIDLKIDDMTNLNYGIRKNHGIRLSFVMEPHHAYDVVKIIDNNKKTISFNIVAKM